MKDDREEGKMLFDRLTDEEQAWILDRLREIYEFEQKARESA